MGQEEIRDAYGDLRGGKRLGVRLSSDLAQRVDALVKRRGETTSRVVRRALIRGLEALEREEKGARKKK